MRITKKLAERKRAYVASRLRINPTLSINELCRRIQAHFGQGINRGTVCAVRASVQATARMTAVQAPRRRHPEEISRGRRVTSGVPL